MSELYQGAHVVDPLNQIDGICDIRVADGKIIEVGEKLETQDNTVVDLSGKLLIPGVVDMHVHFREPGSRGESIHSGSLAAVSGGVTTAVAMPNTDPSIDSVINLKSVQEIAERVEGAKIKFAGALTKGRQGVEITEMTLLSKAGAVAFSDDGDSVMNPQVMRLAMLAAKHEDKVIIAHCEDTHLSANGVINEGQVSVLKGLKGQSYMAESVMLSRDLIIAEETGARYHMGHLSCRSSAEKLGWARQKNPRVTAEVAPHHFILTEDDIPGYDTHYKMKPPLRTVADKEAVLQALKEGVITVIASDHAPRPQDKKALEFENAPFGVMGVETLLPLSMKYLVDTGHMPLSQVIACLTCHPAKILGLSDEGHLSVGSSADFVVISPDQPSTYNVEDSPSLSRNTPFQGETFSSTILATYVDGKKRYENS